MLSFLPGPARGAVSLLLFAVNTLVWTVPLLLLHAFKVLLPWPGWKRFWSRVQNRMGTAWISFNNWNLSLTNPVRWDIRGCDGLGPGKWYLVIANHRSWVDILVLQKTFNRRIPFLKFFLKKELFWVPLLGLAWWALDYPFLERSSRADKDLEAIRKAAEKFELLPVSVMNFVEGTRFTPEKHKKSRSPYAHLLKPKSGGMTLILSAMGESFHSILDVSIAYPQGTPSMWGFLCGECSDIRVRVHPIPVTGDLLGDFATDKSYRRRFTTWQKELWARKDEEMAELLGEPTKNETVSSLKETA
jgi:1-acyl-sn-glycerol-3-phosphate acyltransferase